MICGCHEKLMDFGHPHEDGKGCHGPCSPRGYTQPPKSSRAVGEEHRVLTPVIPLGAGAAAAALLRSNAGGNAEQSTGKSNPK